jgi:hypothetical protein
MRNYNCEGHPENRCLPLGEVRVLPAGGDSNMILCFNCFRHEMAFRKEQNQELTKDSQFEIPSWDSLKVYGE